MVAGWRSDPEPGAGGGAMTIATQRTYIRYNGNGTTTEFAVPFPFLASSDLRVKMTADGANVAATQVLGTHYRITRAGTNQEGTVVMVTSPPVGARLEIERFTERIQPIDLTPGAAFPAETLEGGFDRATLQVQELANSQNRAMLVPASDQRMSPLALPVAADRANRILGFDQLGEPVASGSLTAAAEVSDALVAAVAARAAAQAAQATVEADRDQTLEARDAAQAAARSARGVPDPLGQDGKYLLVSGGAPAWAELSTSSVETSIAASLASIRSRLARAEHDVLLAQISAVVDETQAGKIGRFGYTPLTDADFVQVATGLVLDSSGAYRAAEEEVWPATTANAPRLDAYMAATGFYLHGLYWSRGTYLNTHPATARSSGFVSTYATKTPSASGTYSVPNLATYQNGGNLRAALGPNVQGRNNYRSSYFTSLFAGNSPLVFAWQVIHYHGYAAGNRYAALPYTAFPSRIEINFHDALLPPDQEVAAQVTYVPRASMLTQTVTPTPAFQTSLQPLLQAIALGQHIRLVNRATISVPLTPPDTSELSHANHYYYLVLRTPLYDQRDVFYRFRLYRPADTAAPGVLTTTTQAAPQQPSTVDIYTLVDAPDSGFVPSTHLLAEASRDGGTTYGESRTWVDLGALAGGRLWCSTVDVSTQPAGSAVRAKLTLAAATPAAVRLRNITFGGGA